MSNGCFADNDLDADTQVSRRLRQTFRFARRIL
jgi:hypothetical protein